MSLPDILYRCYAQVEEKNNYDSPHEMAYNKSLFVNITIMSRQIRIREQLCQAIHFSFLSIDDESNKHHVPENAQTHFKIIAVSTEFFGLSRIDRHRAINQLLKNEFETGLHALSLHLYTPEEWNNSKNIPLKSPACRDGFNH